MTWQKETDIVIMKVIYDPAIIQGTEKATMVKKTSYVKGSFSQVKDWFNKIMVAEVPKVSPTIRPHFKEWEFVTPNKELFIVNGIRYCKTYVIFTEDKVHWIYYSSFDRKRRLWGHFDINFTFCGCCLQNQYYKVMTIIHENAAKKMV